MGAPKDYAKRYAEAKAFYLETNSSSRLLGTKNMLDSIIDVMNWKPLSVRKDNNIYAVEWNGKYVLGYLDALYGEHHVSLDRKYQTYLKLLEIHSKMKNFSSFCRFKIEVLSGKAKRETAR